ncbi:MAG: hypothetical protein J6B23_09385, partial [Clostridia bacterium]|nr:hypothetical protein [Clostridia bacterium]
VEHYGSDTIQEVILTASGGPFRDFSAEKLRNVRVTDALNLLVEKVTPSANHLPRNKTYRSNVE